MLARGRQLNLNIDIILWYSTENGVPALGYKSGSADFTRCNLPLENLIKS